MSVTERGAPGQAVACPGCARVLGREDVAAAEGFARCTACDAVFLAPAGALGAAFATASTAPPLDVRVRFAPKRASPAGSYRSAQRDDANVLELRLVYATGQATTHLMMTCVLSFAACLMLIAMRTAAEADTARKLGFVAAAFAVLAMAFALLAHAGSKRRTSIEVREGRVIVDRSVEHNAADVERIVVVQRMAPSREVASRFGKLAADGQSTTPVFDLVARVGARDELLATFPTPDRALHAQAAVARALGRSAPHTDARLRVDVDPLLEGAGELGDADELAGADDAGEDEAQAGRGARGRSL